MSLESLSRRSDIDGILKHLHDHVVLKLMHGLDGPVFPREFDVRIDPGDVLPVGRKLLNREVDHILFMPDLVVGPDLQLSLRDLEGAPAESLLADMKDCEGLLRDVLGEFAVELISAAISAGIRDHCDHMEPVRLAADGAGRASSRPMLMSRAAHETFLCAEASRIFFVAEMSASEVMRVVQKESP